MTQESILWTTNGTGDGAAEITRAQWIDMFTMLLLRDNTLQGVAAGYLSALAVSSTGNNNVRVASGGGVVRGFLYRNTANVDLTIPSPAADTGFRAILRADWTLQTVRATHILNTTGVTDPPALTQVDGDTWEISLATGTITSGGVIAVTSAPTYLYFNTKVSTVMLDDDAVTQAKLADDAVGAAQIIALAVGTGEIADDAVTQAKLADDSVGSAQIIADAVGAPEIAAGAVGTSELANDSVTDAKAGDRIIQLPERVGNSATDWQDSGITTIAPGAIRMHVGARNCTISAGNAAGTLTNLTFPTAYSDKPWMGMTLISTSTQVVVGQLENITATDFDVRVTRKDETDTGSEWVVLCLWQSIGGA
jgi:hypothetical protein